MDEVVLVVCPVTQHLCQTESDVFLVHVYLVAKDVLIHRIKASEQLGLDLELSIARHQKRKYYVQENGEAT